MKPYVIDIQLTLFAFPDKPHIEEWHGKKTTENYTTRMYVIGNSWRVEPVTPFLPILTGKVFESHFDNKL
jgi:hypothetical protein